MSINFDWLTFIVVTWSESRIVIFILASSMHSINLGTGSSEWKKERGFCVSFWPLFCVLFLPCIQLIQCLEENIYLSFNLPILEKVVNV